MWLFTMCNVFTVSSNNIAKYVLKLFNVCNTFKPETLDCQLILVLFFNVVKPLTFNDDNNVVLLFNWVKPLTFNDDNNVVLLSINTLFK